MIKRALFLVFIFLFSTPSKATELLLRADLEKCNLHHYCTTIKINGRKTKLLVDTGSIAHILFFQFHQSDPQLKPLHSKYKSNQYRSKEPIFAEINGYKVALKDVYLIGHRDFFKEDYDNGVSGILHPQSFEDSYFILDFKNKELLVFSETPQNMQGYLQKKYQASFEKIQNYVQAPYGHFFIKVSVNDQEPEYFLLDSGGINSVENEYAKAKQIVGQGNIRTLTSKTEVSYARDVIYKIQNIPFMPYQDVVVTKDHNLAKAHEKWNHIDIKGIIGLEIFEKSIWAFPGKIKSGQPLYFYKFR